VSLTKHFLATSVAGAKPPALGKCRSANATTSRKEVGRFADLWILQICYSLSTFLRFCFSRQTDTRPKGLANLHFSSAWSARPKCPQTWFLFLLLCFSRAEETKGLEKQTYGSADPLPLAEGLLTNHSFSWLCFLC
jgi:hypothetical protein